MPLPITAITSTTRVRSSHGKVYALKSKGKTLSTMTDTTIATADTTISPIALTRGASTTR